MVTWWLIIVLLLLVLGGLYLYMTGRQTETRGPSESAGTPGAPGVQGPPGAQGPQGVLGPQGATGNDLTALVIQTMQTVIPTLKGKPFVACSDCPPSTIDQINLVRKERIGSTDIPLNICVSMLTHKGLDAITYTEVKLLTPYLTSPQTIRYPLEITMQVSGVYEFVPVADSAPPLTNVSWYYLYFQEAFIDGSWNPATKQATFNSQGLRLGPLNMSGGGPRTWRCFFPLTVSPPDDRFNTDTLPRYRQAVANYLQEAITRLPTDRSVTITVDRSDQYDAATVACNRRLDECYPRLLDEDACVSEYYTCMSTANTIPH